MKPCLYRGDLDVEHRRCFRDAELLDAAQHEDAPILFGETVDRRLEDLDQVASDGSVFRLRGFPIGKREHVVGVVDEHRTPAPPAVSFVHRDSREPGRESRRPAKLVEMKIREHVSRLDYVARLVVVADDCAREPEQQSVVAPHDELEQRVVAGAHAAYDRGVVDRLPRVGAYVFFESSCHLRERCSRL